ncbi:mCG1033795, partial [Mus musculus]
GPPPNNQMGGRERRGSCTNNETETVLKLYQDPNVLRKVQGLNAQAKGEVQIIISGRGRAIQARGEVIISGRGRAIELHILRQLHREAGTWRYQGVVRTSVMT